MLLQHIIDKIESVVPLRWQEEWDNSGLQVGDRNAEIHAALLAMDVTESVVNEAIIKGCDLILSHHPLLFHPLKHLTGSTPQERCVEMAIRNHIAIYSSHTCMDAWQEGVSGRMAEMCGVHHYRVLAADKRYESDKVHGLGVIGMTEQPLAFGMLLQRIVDVFSTGGLRYVAPINNKGLEDKNQLVQRIAFCGGAGSGLLEEAIAAGADVYVSADFKYHELQAAYTRIAVVDMDHWVSEQFTRDIFYELVNDSISCIESLSDRSPVHYWKKTK